MSEQLLDAPDLGAQLDQKLKGLEAFHTKYSNGADVPAEEKAAAMADIESVKVLRELVDGKTALQAFKSAHAAAEEKAAEDSARAKTAGEIFEAKAAEAPSGQPFTVDLKGVWNPIGEKNLVTTTGLTPQGLNLTRRGVLAPLEMMRPLTILDLVTRGTSDADSIEWVETTFTNNAREVEEASALAGTSGTKPDSDNTYTAKVATAVTIAHLKHVTEKTLRNRGYIQGLIEGELAWGLEARTNSQIIVGDGVNPNMRGVLNTSGIQAQAFSTDVFETVLKAVTKVRVGGRGQANAVVIDPAAYEAMLLTRDANGQFYFGGPGSLNPNITLWGVPVVQAEDCPKNTAIVADWRTANLLTIDSARIAWTDSHGDNFARNIKSCRAEVDVLFFIERPGQFIQAALV